jgi:hypothetical protein
VLATPQKTEPEEPSPDPRAEERDEAAAWTDTRKRFIESLAGVAFTTYTLTDFAGLRDYALSVPVSTATRNCPALLSSPGGRVEGLLDSRAAAAVVTVKGAVADEVTGTLAVVDDPESLDVLAFGVPGGPLHRLDEQGARQLLIA